MTEIVEHEEPHAYYRNESLTVIGETHIITAPATYVVSRNSHVEGAVAVSLHMSEKEARALMMNLRDGLIWDIPIFGVFSPALDTIMPGLGSSRAREGSATFAITNGVVYSDDLKVETLTARLRYWGTINLKGIVDARMEAQLFRNAWVVGPVISLALWPVSKTFEYHITGSIHKPKSDPVYIPKVLFFPLHPVATIKDMLPEQTNSVPEAVAPPVSSPHPARKP